MQNQLGPFFFRSCDPVWLTKTKVVRIENVGDLVCPAMFDLGEALTPSPGQPRAKAVLRWLSSTWSRLADLGTAVVIEFAGRDDEMVEVLLESREDQYQD